MKIVNGSSQTVQSWDAPRMFMMVASVLMVTLQSASATQADETSIVLIGQVAVNPFIRHLKFSVNPIANLKSVQFTVQPKPGSVTRPISATYSSRYLSSRGHLDAAGNLKIPVFGLYDGFTNTVTLTYVFRDNSSTQRLFSPTTAQFHSGCNYDGGTVVLPRTRSTSLSYDFMLLKDLCSHFSPALMDTDGALRWVGTAGVSTFQMLFSIMLFI